MKSKFTYVRPIRTLSPREIDVATGRLKEKDGVWYRRNIRNIIKWLPGNAQKHTKLIEWRKDKYQPIKVKRETREVWCK